MLPPKTTKVATNKLATYIGVHNCTNCKVWHFGIDDFSFFEGRRLNCLQFPPNLGAGRLFVTTLDTLV